LPGLPWSAVSSTSALVPLFLLASVPLELEQELLLLLLVVEQPWSWSLVLRWWSWLHLLHPAVNQSHRTGLR
jgi:hypothetical protein